MFGKQVLVIYLIGLLSPFTSKADPLPPNAPHVYYEDCGTKYQCFGWGEQRKNECVDNKDCTLLLTTESHKTGATFTLLWSRAETSTDNSVLVGLSKDTNIGEDSVIKFLINPDKTVIFEHGLSTPVDHDKFGITKHDITGIAVTKIEYSSGLLTAVWTRDIETTVGTAVFNLQTDKFHIFFAYGLADDKADSQSYSVEFIHPLEVQIVNPVGPIDNATSISPPTIPTIAPTIAPTTTLPLTTAKLDIKQQLLDRVKEIDIRLNAEIRILNDKGLEYLAKMIQKELDNINLMAKELTETIFVPEALKTFEDNFALTEQRINNMLGIWEKQAYRQLLNVDDILGDANQLVELLEKEIKLLQTINELNAYNDAKLLRDYKEKIDGLMEQIVLSQNDKELENYEIDMDILLNEAKLTLLTMDALYATPSTLQQL